MKRIGFYLMMLVIVLNGMTSCKKETDNHKEKWMITNLEALNAIKANPEYKEIRSPGNEGSIYYKVLQAGDGKDTILYTSMVGVYYKGWFIADYPQYNIQNGYTFDRRLFDDGPPIAVDVAQSTNVTGWRTALQHMVKGDKWEIWIPYQLGYGRDDYKSTGRPTVPGFSTLVYEIEVTNVVR
jgi:peptidylprolyl isomerase/FKBP-type peptidyl-prolyl cis-trans isomerase FklB